MQEFSGKVSELIQRSQKSVQNLVSLLVRHFPSYRDVSFYKGRKGWSVMKGGRVTCGVFTTDCSLVPEESTDIWCRSLAEIWWVWLWGISWHWHSDNVCWLQVNVNYSFLPHLPPPPHQSAAVSLVSGSAALQQQTHGQAQLGRPLGSWRWNGSRDKRLLCMGCGSQFPPPPLLFPVLRSLPFPLAPPAEVTVPDQRRWFTQGQCSLDRLLLMELCQVQQLCYENLANTQNIDNLLLAMNQWLSLKFIILGLFRSGACLDGCLQSLHEWRKDRASDWLGYTWLSCFCVSSWVVMWLLHDFTVSCTWAEESLVVYC